MENQIASKSNLDTEEVDDPEENPEVRENNMRNYNTELFPINEEVPYTTNSNISEIKSTNGNISSVNSKFGYKSKPSTYYSLASHSDNLNETFLLCFLMTPRLLRLFTDNGISLPYMFRLSPGPRMMKTFVDHYIFEFLEPESLTTVGSIDLSDVKEVCSEDKLRSNRLAEIENYQNLNIFFIETDTTLD